MIKKKKNFCFRKYTFVLTSKFHRLVRSAEQETWLLSTTLPVLIYTVTFPTQCPAVMFSEQNTRAHGRLSLSE